MGGAGCGEFRVRDGTAGMVAHSHGEAMIVGAALELLHLAPVPVDVL